MRGDRPTSDVEAPKHKSSAEKLRKPDSRAHHSSRSSIDFSRAGFARSSAMTDIGNPAG
jgi:hypothetical protein